MHFFNVKTSTLMFRHRLLRVITGLVLFILNALIIPSSAQTSPVRITGAWLSPDNRLSVQIIAPAAVDSAKIASGNRTQRLTPMPAQLDSQVWILLDASETMLNRQIAVQTVLRSFLAELAAPTTLFIYNRTIQSAQAGNLSSEMLLAQYTATAGESGCLGDALRQLAAVEHPPDIVWRVLVITGGWTDPTGCENPTLPDLAVPVDMVLVGLNPAPELQKLAENTGGVLLTTDVRQLATRLDEVQAYWASDAVVLTGILADLPATDLMLRIVLADGTTAELPLTLQRLPTPTPTLTLTPTLSPVPSITPSPTLTLTPLATATETATPTLTPTETATLTETPTATFTPLPTETDTPTATHTATPTLTPTATDTPTATASFTPTNTATEMAAAIVPEQASPAASAAPVTPVRPNDTPAAARWSTTEVAVMILGILAVMGWGVAIALYFRIPRLIPVQTTPPAPLPEARTFYDSLGPRDQLSQPSPVVRPNAATAMPNLPTRRRQRTDFTVQHDPMLTPLTPDNTQIETGEVPHNEPHLMTSTQLVSEDDVVQMLGAGNTSPATDSGMVIGWLRLISFDPPIDYALYQTKPIMTMGQAIDNHIVLPEDEHILPHHARLDITKSGAVTMTGLSADHPIIIQGQRVTGAYTLHPHDEIQFSEKLRFVFVLAISAVDEDADTEPPVT